MTKGNYTIETLHKSATSNIEKQILGEERIYVLYRLRRTEDERKSPYGKLDEYFSFRDFVKIKTIEGKKYISIGRFDYRQISEERYIELTKMAAPDVGVLEDIRPFYMREFINDACDMLIVINSSEPGFDGVEWFFNKFYKNID